jgi:hypothetical protein
VIRYALLAIALALAAPPAAAEGDPAAPFCAPRVQILAELDQVYGERLIARGLMRAGVVIELLVAEDGASWSLLATGPDGAACLMAVGRGWRPALDPRKERRS